MKQANGLTEREKVILEHLANGHLYKEIANKLFISTETVKKHVQNSYRKLATGNKIEALRRAGIL